MCIHICIRNYVGSFQECPHHGSYQKDVVGLGCRYSTLMNFSGNRTQVMNADSLLLKSATYSPGLLGGAEFCWLLEFCTPRRLLDPPGKSPNLRVPNPPRTPEALWSLGAQPRDRRPMDHAYLRPEWVCVQTRGLRRLYLIYPHVDRLGLHNRRLLRYPLL